MLLFLTLCAGCSPKIQTVPVTPPESLLLDCPTPQVPETMMQSADLRGYALASTRYVLALNAALEMCNADKAALRAWRAALDRGED